MTADDMSGLEPVVFLCKGAKVMLTMNLWPKVGLCNGATGEIVAIIYEDGQQPPDLPIAVIVKFDDYQGPSVMNIHATFLYVQLQSARSWKVPPMKDNKYP